MIHSKRIAKPLRKAILIGCPGEGDNYLYSVATDIQNVKTFLTSSRGGKWKSSEIITLDYPDLTSVASALQNTIADYSFIYFAGHGYETDNDRMICLNGTDVSDLFLLDQNPRQLIILDCCREKEYAVISGIPKDDEWFHFDGRYPERDAFDLAILQSPPGKKIVHATKSGFASWECKKGRGGVFTTSLLLSTRSFQNELPYASLKIEKLLQKAKDIIIQSGDDQEPEIVHSEGNLQVPFALYIKTEPKPALSQNFSRHQPRRTFKRETSNSGLLKVGLFFLALAIIAEHSE